MTELKRYKTNIESGNGNTSLQRLLWATGLTLGLSITKLPAFAINAPVVNEKTPTIRPRSGIELACGGGTSFEEAETLYDENLSRALDLADKPFIRAAMAMSALEINHLLSPDFNVRSSQATNALTAFFELDPIYGIGSGESDLSTNIGFDYILNQGVTLTITYGQNTMTIAGTTNTENSFALFQIQTYVVDVEPSGGQPLIVLQLRENRQSDQADSSDTEVRRIMYTNPIGARINSSGELSFSIPTYPDFSVDNSQSTIVSRGGGCDVWNLSQHYPDDWVVTGHITK